MWSTHSLLGAEPEKSGLEQEMRGGHADLSSLKSSLVITGHSLRARYNSPTKKSARGRYRSAVSSSPSLWLLQQHRSLHQHLSIRQT
ncbi:hypothetical protein CRENBAI_003848 [Crenichthys baileyi]|uniref:Uncharacterized protein n=1 Tax=Crenichthys baileyi TaxID=28760 RepID=A0AAV9RGW8_9TELE